MVSTTDRSAFLYSDKFALANPASPKTAPEVKPTGAPAAYYFWALLYRGASFALIAGKSISFMTTIKKVLSIITPAEARGFVKLTVVILCMGLLEILGVASILPFMQLVANPDGILQYDVVQAIVDYFGFNRTRQLVLASGGIVVGLIVVANLFSIYATWLQYTTSWQFIHHLSKRLMAGYLRMPYPYFLTTPTAELSSYVLSQIGDFVNGLVVPLVEIVGRGIVVLVLFAMLLWVDFEIALVMFGALGSAYVVIYLAQRNILSRLGRERMLANVQRFQVLQQVFDGIKTVKAYNRQGFFFNHFAEHSDRFARLQPRYQVLTAAPKNILEILAFTSIIAITIYMFLNRGDFSEIVPTLSLYAVAGYRLLPALQKTFKAISSLRHNQPVLDKIHESLRMAGSGRDFPSALPAPLIMERELRIEALHFRYEGAERDTLGGIGLTLRKGQTIAVVGSTGSGKTTLIDLMVGLLRPTSGRLVVDDTELTVTNLPNWRSAVAYVPQDVFLFDDTILNNVTMGGGAGAEEVEKALDLADIGAFVRGLPDGLRTTVGEKGVRLSGGQRQRLGLARALLANPSVLILDEATSALDNVTERGIIDALNNLPRNITTVVIAHRLSTVQHADCIYFLDNGVIVDQGVYDELVGSNAAFAAMAQLN